MRRLLEPHAAASAAQARTPDDLAVLRDAVGETTATLDGKAFERFYRASEIFRNTWLRAVPNGELRTAIQRYSGQVQSVRLATMRDRAAHETVVAGQCALLRAFECRDALAAAERMLRFVIEAEDAFRRMSDRDRSSANTSVPIESEPSRMPSSIRDG